jgi:uncharacterized protein YjbI with pentapeptide repeats
MPLSSQPGRKSEASRHQEGSDASSNPCSGPFSHVAQHALSHAILTHANLSNTSLFAADLSSAILSDAILNNAPLTGANLIGTNLIGANLTDALLRGAHIINEQLADVRSLKGAILPEGSTHL